MATSTRLNPALRTHGQGSGVGPVHSCSTWLGQAAQFSVQFLSQDWIEQLIAVVIV